MTTAGTEYRVSSPLAVATETVSPPDWVWDLVDRSAPASSSTSGQVQDFRGADSVLLSACIPGATSLGALQLQQSVCTLYLSLTQRLESLHFPHAVRLWNFIPHIHARMGSRSEGILDRYMVFNAGRYAAYARWYGETGTGPRSATATGIGHSGEDLLVHCLATRTPGIAVENPRQVPAYRYSLRRGPLPPCFARATVATLDGDRLLMVGGTASVRGEMSVHPGDLEAQFAETLTNMAALIVGKAEMTKQEIQTALSRYRTLRVYCAHSSDVAMVRRGVQRSFASLDSVEYVRADVCRRTLLVEIEGVASL